MRKADQNRNPFTFVRTSAQYAHGCRVARHHSVPTDAVRTFEQVFAADLRVTDLLNAMCAQRQMLTLNGTFWSALDCNYSARDVKQFPETYEKWGRTLKFNGWNLFPYDMEEWIKMHNSKAYGIYIPKLAQKCASKKRLFFPDQFSSLFSSYLCNKEV